MQAEKSFRKSKVRKGVTRRESESSGEVMQGPEVARSAEARLKARGSDWPVLLTCPGCWDASPALEREKVCKTSVGKGLGWDVQFWNVTSSLRGSLCVMGRT